MAHTPSHRGVTSYGKPVDRLTGGNVPVPPEQNPTSLAMAQGQGSDLGLGDPFEQAYKDFLAQQGNIRPTPRYGSGGGGISASDALAKRKYEDELALQQRQIDAYRTRLSGGGYRSGQDQLLKMLSDQAGRSRTDVEDIYGRGIKNIDDGYGDAQKLQDAGFLALQQYLTQNPNNPYANVAVSAGPTQDDLAGLLGAYGVSADPVRAQVAAEGAAAQQGAAGFQNLLDVLGASAQQSDASRLAEMMMSQNFANTSLGSQRAGAKSQAASAQANALAQIQAQLAQSQMEQEQSAAASRQQLEESIAAAGGDIPVEGDDPADKPAAPAVKQKPIDALKARMETANPSLKKKIEKFIAANPKAGRKKIEQAFPKVSSKMK